MPENQAVTVEPTDQADEVDESQGIVDPDFDVTDSLMRLVVGGTLEGSDELVRRLQAWEQELADLGNEPLTEDDIENLAQYIRITFIGFLFATKWQAARAVPRLLQASGVLAKKAFSPLQPLTENSLTRQAQSRFGRLEKRGQEQIASWLAIGLNQEPRARILARYAATDVVDDVIAQLAENPELEALVQQQSMGLASEIVDGVRKQTVTADTVAERTVRKIFGRPVRATEGNSDDVASDETVTPSS